MATTVGVYTTGPFLGRMVDKHGPRPYASFLVFTGLLLLYMLNIHGTDCLSQRSYCCSLGIRVFARIMIPDRGATKSSRYLV